MMHDPLGDGISCVELEESMGDDLLVVNSARVSLNKRSTWAADMDFSSVERVLKMSDAGLIRYLSKHNHWTPFGQPQLRFRIKMPIFVIREWYRHTVGFVRNEVSRRYVDSPPEFYLPHTWRRKPTGGIKQGSGAEFDSEMNLRLIGRAGGAYNHAADEYNRMIADEVAPEMARMVLPFSMYTEFIETASLFAYSRLCGLRVAPDAQRETRLFAEAIAQDIEERFPASWKALVWAANRPAKMRELLERIKTLDINPTLVAEIEEVLA